MINRPNPQEGGDPNAYGTSGSVRGPRGRRKSSPLGRFYRNFRRKAIVDPLALLAFILAVVPAGYALWWWVYPASLTVIPPGHVTFRKEVYQLADGKKEEVIRLAGAFSFENGHPASKATIDSATAILTLGSATSTQPWVHFITSYENLKDTSKLEISVQGNATPFRVLADSHETKEIYFAPRQGEPSEPLRYAMTFERFKQLVEAGERPQVEFIVQSGGKTYRFVLQPRTPLNIPKYLAQKDWTVQEMAPVR